MGYMPWLRGLNNRFATNTMISCSTNGIYTMVERDVPPLQWMRNLPLSWHASEAQSSHLEKMGPLFSWVTSEVLSCVLSTF